MQKKDFTELDDVPEPVRRTADMLAANAAHLARMLKTDPYEGIG